MEEVEYIEIKKSEPAGPLVGVIIVLLILCIGALYVFMTKRQERQKVNRTPNVITSTTTIDLGTTTITTH